MTHPSDIPPLDFSKIRKDKTLGYEYVYQPDHPMANKSGKVYVHRYNAAIAGRQIDGMHVHHRNEIRDDNEIDNLDTLTPNDHAREHVSQNLREYVEGLRVTRLTYRCGQCEVSFTALPSENKKFCSKSCFYESRVVRHTHTCVVCEKIFESKEKERKTCSRQCGNKYAASFRKKNE